ncbi:GNAT family N-acetyltransferase [Microbulbifer sp. MLAF003]|uniref:arsinothricin resistance N-acetyltransferase ArsN1 family B n=1 Tax=unclassified Microbulbifer TaxID=2619833 RepID=UPI0024ADA4A8|nr:arsinothricin resistance N-acetyltransferase ArsN1 family B [Microbulbifer sp. MLAF003]WHI53187.1 GNAT family N-acetyltransferase [Microbulbifer sp. MLAF003]
MIRLVTTLDSAEIAEIYNYYIESTFITFETEPVSTEIITNRIEECSRNKLPWLVAEYEGRIVGYCYASKWKGRCAYQHSVEATVYLDTNSISKGWGSKLYAELLKQLIQLDVHAVICGIALPNASSIALHEKFGMKKVAHFKEVGYKFGQWVDVGYWQCLLSSGK